MINTLPMIKREMKRKHVTGADIARKLNLHISTITGMLHRPTLQVQRLVELSRALNYNFFREIAGELSIKEPENEEQDLQREKELLKQVTKLMEENKTLKTKVEVLEDVIVKLK